MADTEEEHRDLDSALPTTASPPTMRKRMPARTMLALLMVLAVVVVVAVMALIPNPGATP